MESAEFPNYIAAGCLVLDKAENKFPHEIWSLLEPAQWRHFGPFVDDEKIQDGTSESRFLAPEVQRCLLSSSGCLSSFAGLLSHRWIHMGLSISLDDPAKAVARVYILPDDIENFRIPRWDPSLRKARLALLGRLDFSKKAWKGEASAARSPNPPAFGSPAPASGPDDCEDQSLLQMFNSIPSPDPKLEDIQDFDARDAAYKLIDSDITGLKSALYSYQRRSAVLMLQRETQGQKILDPRLVKVVDQLGTPWYYDAVAGTSFREPRYYDRPCGGILAEEMGAGKTLICLALILATRHIPSSIPDIHRTDSPVVRPRLGSLADMAAACITRNSVPWRTVFGSLEPNGIEYSNCVDAIRRNPGFYEVPPPQRRKSRQSNIASTSAKIYLSHASLVIVPPNLVQQWKQEIAKHTSGLTVLVVDKKQKLPPVVELADFDVVLFSSTRFERMWKGLDPNFWEGVNTLARINFKRCIVDEGHRLGNSTMHKRSDVHLFIDHLRIEAKWIVTGTPSKGLFGIDDTPSPQSAGQESQSSGRQAESSRDLEKDDLKRIGSIATYYLQMRPWANLPTETEDSQADWTTYVMQPRHSPRSAGRADCLKRTLESLIVRHRLSELGSLLPTVDEKIVYLDGSYQDTLVLNLFSMMIIANAVQSERKDQDYLFHPRQRKALIELVSNLRRASFFGGSFFSPAEIRKTVEMAEEFLREGKVQISDEDNTLLREAIAAGRLAETNSIKKCANLFHEIPLYVQNFPWGAGQPWSLDFKEGDPVCTDSPMVLELQKSLQPLVDAPTSLQIMFESGRFAERGLEARLKGINNQDPASEPAPQRPGSGTLAGNAQPGQDNGSPGKRRSVILGKGPAKVEETFTVADFNGIEIAAPLAGAQLISTASAKLSYLIDQISKYQEQEQIIVFYENDNVAYYLAGVLEIVGSPFASCRPLLTEVPAPSSAPNLRQRVDP